MLSSPCTVLAPRQVLNLTRSSLAGVFFRLAVVCCAVAQIAIARSALRVPPHPEDPATDVPRPRRATEVAWTIIPALGLAFVLLVTWHAIHQPQYPPFMPPGAMHDMSGMGHAAPMR